MSAVFSILEGIVQAITAVIEAIPKAISVLVDIAGGFAQVLEAIAKGVAAIPRVIEGIGQVVPAQMMLYVVWFAIEASILAFLPGYALLINTGFFLFTIYGLWQGVTDIRGSSTAVTAVLAFVALVVNVYLVLTVG
jgi:hypothetical protein